MSNTPENFPRILPIGDSALLIELGDSIDPDINDRVYTLDDWLNVNPPDGILSWIPGYASLLISYNPLILKFSEVSVWISEQFQSCPSVQERKSRLIEIPVRYGGEDGPDLEYVADQHQISPVEVVQKHTAPIYRVGMMGFTPGFAYLMGLDPGLATPRLANPRTHVPAGSVGIAGDQTGIYPLESPGGWRLIGRTDLALFDPLNEPHFLLSPGDEVRFLVASESAVL
jgi:inhibitor of KinA